MARRVLQTFTGSKLALRTSTGAFIFFHVGIYYTPTNPASLEIRAIFRDNKGVDVFLVRYIVLATPRSMKMSFRRVPRSITAFPQPFGTFLCLLS